MHRKYTHCTQFIQNVHKLYTVFTKCTQKVHNVHNVHKLYRMCKGMKGPWRDSGSCLKREMAGELHCDWLSLSADNRALWDRLKGLDPPLKWREAGNGLPRQSQNGVISNKTGCHRHLVMAILSGSLQERKMTKEEERKKKKNCSLFILSRSLALKELSG